MASYTVTTYRANQDYSIDAEFQCPSCGYASAVHITAHASSAGHGRANQAVAAATNAAHNAARAKLEMLSCPRCKRQTPAAAAFFQRQVVRPGITTGIAAFVVLVAQVLFAVSAPLTTLRTVAFLLHVPAVPMLLFMAYTTFMNWRNLPNGANIGATFAQPP